MYVLSVDTLVAQMASSAEKPHHHLPTPYATTAAPPPTPSTSLPNLNSSATNTSDALSNLLHRLPPTLSLSLPTRRSSTTSLISLSEPTELLHGNLLSASTKLGFFHLTHQHPISTAAESAALSLFNLPHHQKQLHFPNNWPLGYNDDDDHGESFCIDSSCFTVSVDNDIHQFGSLHEFIREMEIIGLRVIQELASAIGFESPNRDQLRSLLWISDNGFNKQGRIYPYVVGLHHIKRPQKYSLWSDSGWVNVSGHEDSVLLTLGDIAQVWSNGKCKKVRGRPMPCLEDDNPTSHCITMSLLITLPIETTVHPLIANLAINGYEEQEINEEENDSCIKEQRMFNSFSFEDYAWRVYHERLLVKDPLVRYRI